MWFRNPKFLGRNAQLSDIQKINALIRRYHGIDDPSVLTDDDWALRYHEILYTLKLEGEIIGNRVAEVISRMFWETFGLKKK